MCERPWINCADKMPPVGVVVETKIDDANGCRNEQKLKLYQREPGCRSMWVFPDWKMYVYYQPTHWRETEPAHV